MNRYSEPMWPVDMEDDVSRVEGDATRQEGD